MGGWQPKAQAAAGRADGPYRTSLPTTTRTLTVRLLPILIGHERAKEDEGEQFVARSNSWLHRIPYCGTHRASNHVDHS
jgi:hypothetical protein